MLASRFLFRRNSTYNTCHNKFIIFSVTTVVNPIYSRTQNGYTGTMDLSIILRISEMEFRYTPSLLQEFKWAWPQYLSLLIIFHWLFGRMRKFVFSNRLLMAWEIIPWRKKDWISLSNFLYLEGMSIYSSFFVFKLEWMSFIVN